MSLQGHKKRIIVALVALPLLLVLIIKLPPYWFLGLLVAVNIIGIWEFLKMYKTSSFWMAIGIILSVTIFLLNCFYFQYALHYYAVSFMLIAIARLLFKKEPYLALNEISPVITGLLYIPTLLSFQWFLRQQGWQWIIYLLSLIHI